jgi:hypothetical protein
VGDSDFAVYGVQPNKQMTINGARFFGGTAPQGTSVRPVGYFVPLETKDGKMFYTGSSGNHQTTFKVTSKEGDKHYTMFFPPGTTNRQIEQAVLGAQQALQNGLDPEKMSEKLGKNPLTTPEAALEEARAHFYKAKIDNLQSTLALQTGDRNFLRERQEQLAAKIPTDEKLRELDVNAFAHLADELQAIVEMPHPGGASTSPDLPTSSTSSPPQTSSTSSPPQTSSTSSPSQASSTSSPP